MKRTILEVTCDCCGVIQRFETASNHGIRTVTIDVMHQLERHQWECRRLQGEMELRDICRACLGKMFR